jgi:regulatory protein
MIVTKIERQRKRPQRVNIFVDGEFAAGAHESVLLQMQLRKGDAIEQRVIEKLRALESFEAARDKALRLISHRLRSRQEIRTRLMHKEFDPGVIDEVVARLSESGVLDDERFAKAFVHDLIMRKSVGRSLLRRELILKGIAKEIIERTLQTSVQDDEEETRALESAESQLAKYRRSSKKTDQLKQRQRIVSFLGRRGFDFSIIRSVTRKLFPSSPEA